MSSPHPFDLDTRRQALEELGFVVVEWLPDGFIAYRLRWHWDLFSRLTTLVRVRRVDQVTTTQVGAGNSEMQRLMKRHNVGRVPRGFQNAWALVDVWLAEAADDTTTRKARNTVGKGWARSFHPVVVTDREVAVSDTPFWGGALWSKTRQCIDAAALGDVRPAETSALGMLIGWLVMVPNAIVLTLMCCGLPVLAWGVAVLTENDPQPAPPPG